MEIGGAADATPNERISPDAGLAAGVCAVSYCDRAGGAFDVNFRIGGRDGGKSYSEWQ